MTSASTLVVNGSERPLGDARTLAQLLESLKVTATRVAVELNGEIIPPAAWAEQPIVAGDQIEIIQFVGGG